MAIIMQGIDTAEKLLLMLAQWQDVTQQTYTQTQNVPTRTFEK